jgi:hypothetical protein
MKEDSVSMFIDPSEEQLAAVRALEHDGPITMLNLLRFKPDGGRAQYKQYGRAAQPLLERTGASTRYLGAVAAKVIGGEPWDLVLLIDYTGRRAVGRQRRDGGGVRDVHRATGRHHLEALV